MTSTLKTAEGNHHLGCIKIQWHLLMWVGVQFSPDSRPALAVALLQVDVLRIDGYVSDHVDDGMGPGGAQGRSMALKAGEDDGIYICKDRFLSPEENYRVIEGAHRHVRVVVGVDIQTT